MLGQLINFNVIFLRHYECDKCQTLNDSSTHWALPIHTTLSDLDCISSSFNWKFFVLIWLSWNFVWLLITSDSEYTTTFYFYTCSRETSDISSFEKKINVDFFTDTFIARSLKPHDNSLLRVYILYLRRDILDISSVCTSVILSLCPIVSGRYLLNGWTIFNQTWHGSARQSVMRKKWFTIFNVKVTVRSYIIKMWLSIISSKLQVCLPPL